MFWKADGDYLSLAQKADRAAEVAQSAIAKRYWQRIAEGYRSLGAKKPEPAAQDGRRRREICSLSEVARTAI